MRKITLVIVLILIFIITILVIVRQNYSLSREYNYVTAKLDIMNRNCRIVTVDPNIVSSGENEINAIASKYGFKNIYFENATTNELKGIGRYNETIEIFLAIRNGPGWRYSYQKEIDSLTGITAPPDHNRR